MTRNHLRWILGAVLTAYAIALFAGVVLRRPFELTPSGAYSLYKDLIPLLIAIPAAYLAFAFQRRSSYLQALRSVWSHMVSAVAGAMVYTEIESPTEDQQLSVLTKLSIAIEEVRGVFKNIPAPTAPDGWYPFEPVKQIYDVVLGLGFGAAANKDRRIVAKAQIRLHWKRSRSRLLAEFDRDKPTYHHAEYEPQTPLPGVAADNSEKSVSADAGNYTRE